MTTRAILKTVVTGLLDRAGAEGEPGHQDSKARRYVIRSPGGSRLEIMLQVDEDSAANLWAPTAAVGPLVGGDIAQRASPRAGLWVKTNRRGKRLYGRHSALRSMVQLGDAELTCFTLRVEGEARAAARFGGRARGGSLRGPPLLFRPFA